MDVDEGAVGMPSGQREYKDRLFSFLFGNEAHKDWTLSLYNAVNGTAYTDESLVQLTTIRETLYLGMHNDVSFLITSLMNLYEQQSSFNPNMPVRMLQYMGNLSERFIIGNNKNKYGRTLIELPVPKLVVFYNGLEDKPDQMTLRLSDAFPLEMREMSDIQVRVRMLNINAGQNQALLAACKPLEEYSWIVDMIRRLEREFMYIMDDDKRLEAS